MTRQAAALVGLIEAVETFEEVTEGYSTNIDQFCHFLCPLRRERTAVTYEDCIKYDSEWDGVL